jgi:Na+/melibiose symporter-like transporter
MRRRCAKVRTIKGLYVSHVNGAKMRRVLDRCALCPKELPIVGRQFIAGLNQKTVRVPGTPESWPCAQSPTIHDLSAILAAHFNRPSGTRHRCWGDPAMNCQATIESPSGTKTESVQKNPYLRASHMSYRSSILFKSKPLIIFGICAMLFHFANAALLPLVGQKLAAAFPKEATAMISTCIIAAQLVMLPIALLVGRTADTWGRKPLFLVGFPILPIRAVLYTLSDNSFWLIGVQILDGAGAGIFGALTSLVIADIMRGTGRYNLAQGAVATMQGIGASLSGLAAGEIVDHFGYSPAFLILGGAALVALIVFAIQMPETCRMSAEHEP